MGLTNLAQPAQQTLTWRVQGEKGRERALKTAQCHASVREVTVVTAAATAAVTVITITAAADMDTEFQRKTTYPPGQSPDSSQTPTPRPANALSPPPGCSMDETDSKARTQATSPRSHGSAHN